MLVIHGSTVHENTKTERGFTIFVQKILPCTSPENYEPMIVACYIPHDTELGYSPI